MRRACGVLGVVAGLLLGACGPPPPTSGYVRGKDYKPAHTIHHPGHDDCYGRDKYGACTYSVHTPASDEHVPDMWFLRLRDCVTKDNGKQECNEGWLRVDETDYHNFEVGQHYPDPR